MPEAISRASSIKVSAHVLVQLGEELVTDVEQAILECVKNAYDADSPGCKIKIDTTASGVEIQKGKAGDLLPFYQTSENVEVQFRRKDDKLVKLSSKGVPTQIDPDELITRELSWKGSISIEDSGDGISAEGIAGSWLVISSSAKRVPFGKKKTTNLGRTPLGDKGLGRLGSMKLGDLLLVESARSADIPLTSALFRWADCDYAHTVDQIPVRVLENIPNKTKFKGTRVSILGLRELEQWAHTDRALAITKSLARLISPFEAKSHFPVTVEVDGHKSSLVAVTDILLSRAIAEFHFKWSNDGSGKQVLSCRARFKEKLFRTTGGSAKQQAKSSAVFDKDDGHEFLEWVGTIKRLNRFKIIPRPSREWFVEMGQDFLWEQIVPTSGPPCADPGSFTGSFYYFNLNELSEDKVGGDIDGELDVESVAGMGIDRSMIKEMAGVSILRDGFRVRSSGDWLRMSEGMTTGSTYNLRYYNTLGFFSLSGEDNNGLVEKSDREGFLENSAYRGFMAVANACKTFSNEAIENIRRAQDKYANDRLQTATEPQTSERSLDLVDETMALAASARKSAKSVVDSLNHGISMFEKNIGDTGAAKEKAVNTLKTALSAANLLQKDLTSSARGTSAVKILRNEINDNKERMLSLYESAAVGLSARGLAHELRTHLVEIRRRATSLENSVKNGKVSEITTMPHIRAIRASCGSISNAASLIDPMLPRARAVKETIDLHEFIEEYISHRQHGLDKENIDFKMTDSARCVVRMNRGRLLQVLDNLMRNSVYWLRRGTQVMKVEREKKILIDITKGGFNISDSGPGVDPGYDESIFEMFVSAKPADERGQGLGLFIISQLLAADGAEIYLAAERNPDGKRYRFVVNLSSVVGER